MINPDAVINQKRARGRPSKKDSEALAEAKRLKAITTDETPAERVARIAERFTVMYRLTQGAIAGAVRSLIISGAPGTGKSYTIEHLLSSAKDQDRIKYLSIRGTITGINLYKILFRYSGKNDIILLDDADGVYEDEDTMNLMKAALDTTRTRTLSWYSEAATLKQEDIPTSFVYEGSMLFITNKDFQGMIDADSNKMVPHLQALMSRSLYLDLKLHHPDDLIAWIENMVTQNHILVQHGLDRDQEQEALVWLREHYGQVRELSIRTAMKVGTFMLTNPREWESYARVTLLR